MTTSRKSINIILIIITLLGSYYFFPIKLESLKHHQKIGAHRINSIHRLKYATSFYNIIEVDLVYNEKEDFLDVNHPPAPSIHLSFENYLDNLNGNTPFLWLDIKNLSPENSSFILSRLIKVLRKKKYSKENILVESPFAKELKIFQDNGFSISYYLTRHLHALDKKDLTKQLNKIRANLDSLPQAAISSSIENYTLLTKEFPYTKKFLWSLGFNPIRNYNSTSKALNDELVEIVLLSFNTLAENR